MPDAEQHREPKPRPYAHLTVDELRKVNNLTTRNGFDELEARGISSPAVENAKPIMAQAHRPGALRGFLKSAVSWSTRRPFHY